MAVWEWLSGEGAEYCATCRKASRNRDDLDCEECEGRCPDLMPDNAAAWELLQAGATQLRMSGMGGPVGFDYNALALVAESFGIELTPGMCRPWKRSSAATQRDKLKKRNRLTHPRGERFIDNGIAIFADGMGRDVGSRPGVLMGKSSK